MKTLKLTKYIALCFLIALSFTVDHYASDESVSNVKRPREHTPEGDEIFSGQFVCMSPGGHVKITQPKYPKYTGLQHTARSFRTVGGPIFEDGGDGYRYVRYEVAPPLNNTDLLTPEAVESIVNSEQAFNIISTDQSSSPPYSSCGRLEMFFPSQDFTNPAVYHGSAAAIDKNLLVTAAHNFLPPQLYNKPNNKKIMADRVNFEHLLTNNGISKKAVHEMHVATHCFIHPEWEKKFNPHYDIALVFLSESMSLTPEEKTQLLKLHVLPESIEDTIHIVGYPDGHPYMRQSEGKMIKEGAELSKIVYHNANTKQGSSGSPIIRESNSIVGVHTRAPSEGKNYNRGVRMREDLLPFIDECIRQNQIFLENEEKAMAEKAKIQERYEAETAKKHKEEGKIEAKIEMVKNLIGMALPDEQIAKASGLPQEQIEEIRAGMTAAE
ncbi:MAG TPA: hypothetical protein DIC42_02315 [Holosporales bacterium]|nr:hypothetical protein [Holosporales bacterium]